MRGAGQVADRLQGGPDQQVSLPGIITVTTKQQADERLRRHDLQACTDTIIARHRSERMGELLRQPPLHATRRHHHDLRREDVSGSARSRDAKSCASVSGRSQRCKSIPTLRCAAPSGHAHSGRKDALAHRQSRTSSLRLRLPTLGRSRKLRWCSNGLTGAVVQVRLAMGVRGLSLVTEPRDEVLDLGGTCSVSGHYRGYRTSTRTGERRRRPPDKVGVDDRDA